MKIMGIGQSVYDLFFPLPEDLTDNEKRRIYDAKKRVGGPVTNAMITCGLWDCHPYLMTRVGQDAMGNDLIRQLKDCGVNTSTMLVDDAMETTISCILVHSNGNRVILNIPSLQTNPDLKPNWPDETDILLFDGHEERISRQALERYPDAVTVFDGDKYKPETRPIVESVDYLICSKEFAEEITGHVCDQDTYSQLCSINHNHVILTLGEKGCIYQNQRIPAFPAQTIDTTGAGDVFHGAFVYGLSQQWSIDRNIRFSSMAAAIATETVGVKDAIPTVEQVNQRLKKEGAN